MKEAVAHLLDDARLDLGIEGGHGEIRGCAHYVEGGVEVVSAVRKGEGTCVNIAEREMEGCGGEGRGWECQCERLPRSNDGQGEGSKELGTEVGRTGNKDEPVRGENCGSGGIARGGGGRGKCAGELNADVRIKPGTPHEYKVLPELF